MKLATLIAAAVAGASCDDRVDPEPDRESPFARTGETFATPAACAARLAALVRESAPPAYDRAVGLYEVAPSDIRAHRIAARGQGHAIEEFRCLGAEMQARRWTHAIGDVKPFTMEDVRGMSFPN